MLNLLDELTTEDKEKIGAYIDLYGAKGLDRKSVDELLSIWAKNKTKLYHWLGNNLRVQFPFTNRDYIEQFIERQIYRSLACWGDEGNALSIINMAFKQYYEKGTEEKKERFRKIATENTDSLSCYSDRYYYYSETGRELNKIIDGLKGFIERIFFETSLIKGTLCLRCSKKVSITVDGKTYQFQDGEKIWKSIKKLCQILPDAVTEKEFENARILYSTWLNDKKKGYLTISIHPLDFMTMSDNNSNWQSCMSWQQDGCYRVGTLEMLNSNNVFCVYYTSVKEDKGFSFGEYEWNDKKWRGLVIATKEIIVANKAYPYYSKNTNIAVIDKIKELAEKNMRYTYEFGPELYKDMDNIMTDYYLDDVSNSIKTKDAFKKGIYFKSNGMYNDMLHNMGNYGYWCYRNKVKSKKLISYSGKSMCLCCGKPNFLIKEPFYDEGFQSFEKTGTLLCSDCEDKGSCPSCGSFVGKDIREVKINGVETTVCKKCHAQIMLCPCCQKNYIDGYGTQLADQQRYPKTAHYWYCPEIIIIPDEKLKILEENGDVLNNHYSSPSDYYGFFRDKIYNKNKLSTFIYCCSDCYNHILENNLFSYAMKPLDKESFFGSIHKSKPYIVMTESQIEKVYPNIQREEYSKEKIKNIFGETVMIDRQLYSYA